MFIMLPGTVVGIRDIAENKIESNSCSRGAYILVGEDSNKQMNYIVYQMVIRGKEKNKSSIRTKEAGGGYVLF